MKRIISFLLSVMILLSMAGCEKNQRNDKSYEGTIYAETPDASFRTETPEPSFPMETVKTAELKDYSIVYPSAYTVWQMTEVNILKDVLQHITGTQIQAIPDTMESNGKEIIFASSKRETGLSEYVSTFASRLDYVIGVTDGNIVIGGQDYYGDMRAAYTFINEYLGYDDINAVYGTLPEEISGVNKTDYYDPAFTMAVGSFYKHKVPDVGKIKDMKDAHFNAIIIQGLYHPYQVLNEDGTENYEASCEQFRELCLWCTRFDIRLILPVKWIDKNTFDFELRWIEAYEDNPIVWGHYLVDEPELNIWNGFENFADVIKRYKKQYSEKGWKCVLNFTFYMTRYNSFYTGTFRDADAWSFDYYFFEGERATTIQKPGPSTLNESEIQHFWEKHYAEARKNGQEFWSYITAFYLPDYNTEKMLRWNEYINMCFGPSALLYFNYSGWVVDNKYEKLIYWDYAEEANRQIVEIGEDLVRNYDYLGTHEENVSDDDRFMYLDTDYPYFKKIVMDFVLPENDKSPYLMGIYQKKDNKNAYSFIIVNCSQLDKQAYAETTAEPIRMKIEGKATFYRDGVDQKIEMDDGGYYNIECGNGYAWYITVEK